MVTKMRPLAEITTEALRVLYKKMGVVNTVRFVSQYTMGYGNYVQDREQLLEGMTLDAIVCEVRRRRKRSASKPARSRRTAVSRG